MSAVGFALDRLVAVAQRIVLEVESRAGVMGPPERRGALVPFDLLNELTSCVEEIRPGTKQRAAERRASQDQGMKPKGGQREA